MFLTKIVPDIPVVQAQKSLAPESQSAVAGNRLQIRLTHPDNPDDKGLSRLVLSAGIFPAI